VRRAPHIDDGAVALAALASIAFAMSKGHQRANALAERALTHAEAVLAAAEADYAIEVAEHAERMAETT
jgi:hypothetical protein